MTKLKKELDNITKQPLYHISKYTENPVETFVPRIPFNRIDGEDKERPRICVSDSIIGCFKAHPTVMYQMYYFLNSEHFCPYDFMANQHYLPEQGKGGMLFRVYHFNAEYETLYTPEQLVEKGYVGDAGETGEHWLIEKAKADKVTYLLLEKVVANTDGSEWEFVYTEFENESDMETVMPMMQYHHLTRESFSLAQYGKKHTPEEVEQLHKEFENLNQQKE